MSEADIDVVRRVVSFRERDVPAVRQIFDDKSEFTSAVAGLDGGTYRGRDEIEGYVRDLDARAHAYLDPREALKAAGLAAGATTHVY